MGLSVDEGSSLDSGDIRLMKNLMSVMYDDFGGFRWEDEVSLWGLLADYDGSDTDAALQYIGGLNIEEASQGEDDDFMATVATRSGFERDASYTWLGSYLVRDNTVSEVSEPNFVSLMGLGLLLMVSIRRVKRFS